MFYLTEVNDTTIAPSSQMMHSLSFFEVLIWEVHVAIKFSLWEVFQWSEIGFFTENVKAPMMAEA